MARYFCCRSEVQGPKWPKGNINLWPFVIMSRAKHWVFTLNNYSSAEVVALSLAFTNGRFIHIAWAEEVGESGTPHLQGSFSLVKKERATALHKISGLERAALLVMKGKPQQAYDYYANNPDKGSPVNLQCFGTLPAQTQGKRTDLSDATEVLAETGSLKRVAQEFPEVFVKYHAGLRALRSTLTDTSYAVPIGPYPWDYDFDFRYTQILWGSAGLGKTEFAKRILPNALFANDVDDLGHYDPSIHDGIIFDDMDLNFLPRSAQIFMVDVDNNRSIRCRYFNAFIPKNTKKIFITNVFDGKIFLTEDPAISRRIKVTHLRAAQEDEFPLAILNSI